MPAAVRPSRCGGSVPLRPPPAGAERSGHPSMQSSLTHGAGLSRRRFVQGLAAGGAVAAFGAAAQPAHVPRAPVVPELSGTRFELAIGRSAVDFTGRPRLATTVNGSLPQSATSVHWLGLLLPANMERVPGLSFHGFAPGWAWAYRCDVRQSGTCWYHRHSMFQEQAGLYGALVIDPAEPPPYHFDREHVLLLSDWTDLDPAALFRRMKKDAGHDNWYRPTAADLVRDAREHGLRQALRERAMWDRMRMTPSDISDINGHT